MKVFKNFILIGPPGCGKGTQAKRLLKHFKGAHYISTGKLFRKLVRLRTDVGNRIKGILESGGIIYDDLATTLWMYDITFNVKSNQGIIGDGFPRRLQEAIDLDSFFKFLNRKDNTKVILINISEKEALKRLPKRNRADDKAKDIKKRFALYGGKTIPAINYLKKRFNFVQINGEQTREEVFKDILEAVK